MSRLRVLRVRAENELWLPLVQLRHHLRDLGLPERGLFHANMGPYMEQTTFTQQHAFKAEYRAGGLQFLRAGQLA